MKRDDFEDRSWSWVFWLLVLVAAGIMAYILYRILQLQLQISRLTQLQGGTRPAIGSPQNLIQIGAAGNVEQAQEKVVSKEMTFQCIVHDSTKAVRLPSGVPIDGEVRLSTVNNTGSVYLSDNAAEALAGINRYPFPTGLSNQYWKCDGNMDQFWVAADNDGDQLQILAQVEQRIPNLK